jgi:hypothetical protein
MAHGRLSVFLLGVISLLPCTHGCDAIQDRVFTRDGINTPIQPDLDRDFELPEL